jgi:hypothetical protein
MTKDGKIVDVVTFLVRTTMDEGIGHPLDSGSRFVFVMAFEIYKACNSAHK